MFRIIQKRKWWYVLSLLVLIPGIISLFLWGIRFGIDFTGGSQIEYKFKTRPALNEVENLLNPLNLDKITLEPVSNDILAIKLKQIDQETVEIISKSLQDKYAETEFLSFESIGPTIGTELGKKSILMTGLVLLGILLYVTYVFRTVSKNSPVKSWAFGSATIVALFHDTLVVIGIASILGHFINFKVDTLFVTALLTVIGFSVHDTIVVFDRIRENLRFSGNISFEHIVNDSVNQTFVRSINTSATVLIVLSALFIFGGRTLHDFVLILLIGIAAGTYSSIFIASPLLISWEKFQSRR